MQGLLIAFTVIHIIGMIVYSFILSMEFFQDPNDYPYSGETMRRERIRARKSFKFIPVWEIMVWQRFKRYFLESKEDERKMLEAEREATMPEAERIIKRMKTEERLEWERRFNS